MSGLGGSIGVERIDERTAVVVVLADPLGMAADELAATVEELHAAGTHRLVVDFSGLPVLNSKLLDGLVRASRGQDDGEDGGIVVVADHGYVGQILEISETGGLVLLTDTRDEALEALDGLQGPPR